jgi:hypothetical protein
MVAPEVLRVRFRAMVRLIRALTRARGTLVEVAGCASMAVGVHEIYPPAALIFAGAALVFIAQGMEPHE